MIEYLVMVSILVLLLFIISFVLISMGSQNKQHIYSNVTCPCCGERRVVFYITLMGLITPMYVYRCDNCGWSTFTTTFPPMVSA